MQRQKRDLAFLLILQTLAMIIGSVLAHPDSNIPGAIVLPLMMIDLLCLQFLLYRVTAGYAKTLAFKIFYAVLVITQFALNAIVNVETPLAQTYVLASFTYPLSLVVFTIIFYFILQDMFANKHETTYSLLAASNAYFLIAGIFGYIYSIVVLQDASMLDIEIKTGQDIVRRTFELSHYVVAGFDVPDGVSGMLKNLAVVEAFMANLYIIFVVGRLMTSEK
jgi:preprotein translocase subunit YajC